MANAAAMFVSLEVPLSKQSEKDRKIRDGEVCDSDSALAISE